MANLPINSPALGSDKEVTEFFDKYFTKSINYPTNEVNAVIGFFENRGFEKTSAIAVATEILQQAKIDNVKTFKIIDTLKGLNEVQLSEIVTQILNVNRPKTSSLGYSKDKSADKIEKRNIIL
jgi:hypothetical protein